ncbi:zinc-ribbon domain-containing protein [Pyxidicoccus sp. MSG2]|uniref:zinc-ribbon domain-containing protein n=1 Tax=Pyxidicoccus sp. MSG2 TaxID=2996790 RepID=UPI00227183BD|nr:zinc-ribbon domain-containing protein [Pyxidicoccus sp. MSG2]MCY1020663.1 zinc-ribbon domain-containing protein [Pyxidicoccus sp. MSG2]
MIVKCERCQTRFKIPDEKVTDKGVKVRCTKCQNTFRVTRETATGGTGAPPVPPPTGQADPFAEFGVAPDPQHVEITKPGFFAQGVEATRGPPARPPAMPWNSVDGDIDTEAGVFQEPTRIGPMPLPPTARPTATPFDFSEPEGQGMAVPLPAPAGGPGLSGRPATGLYGSAVPPSEALPYLSDGAVPLPGATSGAVPLPGVAGARSAPPPPPGPGPGRVAPAAAAGGSPGAAVPAPVTMFGSPKGAAQAPMAARGGPGGAAPGPGSRPPPAPGAPPAALGPPASGAPPANARRGTAPAPGAAVPPPPFPLGGDDPFADLLGAPGDSAPPVPAGAFDLLPAPKAPAAPVSTGAFGLSPSPRAPATAVPAAAPNPLPSPTAPSADALRRAAAPPTSEPTGAVALGPVRPAAKGAPPPAASFPGEDPFGSIDIDDATVTDVRPSALAPLPAPAGEDPFGSIDVDDVTVTAAYPASVTAPSGEDPFASIGLAGSQGAPPAASPASAAAPAPVAAQPGRAPAPPPRPASSASDLFDLSSDVDPFGEHAGMQPTDTGRAALLGAPPPHADGLEDLASLSESGGGSLLGDVPPMAEAQEFTVTLGKVGAPGTGAVEVLDVGTLPSAPAVTVARPTARPEDVGIPQSRPPSRARKATALVANLVVAAVLVVAFAAVGGVYLREGRVDLSVLSPDRLRTLVVPAPRPLVALDVTNALYETRSGRPLFFVRGEAENRTGAATRVRVRAALYDGNQRVRSAEALAGAVPTPEELHAVGNSEAATALSQRMDAAATPVAPGAKVPFLVMFQEYPTDLGSFRLEVTLEPVPPATAEAGGRTE